jgi:glycosyltransferase involved in cell wall biosynthesis
MITVCQALKEALVELGVASDRVTVLRNGVDLELFRPFHDERERSAARARFGMSGTALVAVGQLIERKGNHLIVEALKSMPGVSLYLAGEGPEREKLIKLATEIGVRDRLHVLGPVAHSALPGLYAAADALVLTSSREGWANVLLEAMACGTPVIATSIWGTPEVVADPAAGVLISERNVESVIAGVSALMEKRPSRAATRLYAEKFSWDDTTQGQLRMFRHILEAASI